MRKAKIIFALIIGMGINIHYICYSQGTVSDNRTMELDTSTLNKPLIAILLKTSFPGILKINILSDNKTTFEGTPVYIFSSSMINYVPGILIRYKKNTLETGVIFRPRLGFLSPSFYRLKKYGLGGFFLQYNYQILNKKLIKNDISIGLTFYKTVNYKTELAAAKYYRQIITSYIVSLSDKIIFKTNDRLWLYIEPAIAFCNYHLNATYFGKSIDEFNGTATYFQIKIGINYIIKKFNNYEN